MLDVAADTELDEPRELPPLDDDMRAFFDFFRAFSGAPDPLSFLSDRGLGEGDVFHLLASWQSRMQGDPSLTLRALELLAGPEGPVPEVRPGKRLSRPAKPAEAPLAATSLGFVVDKPALPFLARSEGAPLPPPSPSPPRPPPRGLGETRDVFRIDKLVLPFAKQKPPPEPPPPRSVPRPLIAPLPASASLSQTRPAVHLYKPAIPFAAKSFAQTALGFRVDPRVLPFASGAKAGAKIEAPRAPVPPPPPRALGETAPAFKVDKPALPFPGGKPPPRAPEAFGETSLALNVDLSSVLPFAKSKPALPKTRLSIEAYATMCAEIWLDPAGALRIIARYGLSTDEKRAEDGAWQARFTAAPSERATWERLSIEAGARIRQRR